MFKQFKRSCFRGIIAFNYLKR